MTIDQELSELATRHRKEIEANLLRMREQADQLSRAAAAANARADFLRALLDVASAAPAAEEASTAEAMTLHEAMVAVLKSAPSPWLKAPDIAQAINHRGLYRMRDGRPVEAQQIHARVGHYPELLRKDGPFITLVDSTAL